MTYLIEVTWDGDDRHWEFYEIRVANSTKEIEEHIDFLLIYSMYPNIKYRVFKLETSPVLEKGLD